MTHTARRGEPTPERLMLLYGNAWEAKLEGRSLGWFPTEEQAHDAVKSAQRSASRSAKDATEETA